jgi:hypothetical protein
MRKELHSKMIETERKQNILLDRENRKRQLPNDIAEWKELDPWGLFAEARYNLIMHFLKQQMASNDIAKIVSTSEHEVEILINKELT